MNQIFDLGRSPFIAVWETTQTCDPDYCLTTGQPDRDPLELTTLEAEKMIREVAELHPPVFVMVGGRPLDRPDIYSLICYAASCDLHPTLVLNASPRLTRSVVSKLKGAGLARLGLVLDGSSPEIHDAVNGEGSFVRTLEALRWANESRLPLQIHTNISRHNTSDLEKIAALLSTNRILLWSLSFPVAAGEGNAEERLSAAETEEIFVRLYRLSQLVSFKVKTVEAPHYRRYVLQQRTILKKGLSSGTTAEIELENGIPGVMPVNETRASLFITNTGEVYPSGCLPLSAGNVRVQKLTDIYRESELFRSLRDVSKLHGKCGRCQFKEICGGSRARALAMAGDMFAEDTTCIYEPPVLRPPETASGESPRA
jgi:AdoMet-dependent heme synthase